MLEIISRLDMNYGNKEFLKVHSNSEQIKHGIFKVKIYDKKQNKQVCYYLLHLLINISPFHTQMFNSKRGQGGSIYLNAENRFVFF